MPNASERSLTPRCKSGDWPVGSLQPAWELKKERIQRILVWSVLSLVALTLAFLADGSVARILTLQSSTFWRDLAVYSSKAGEGWVVATVGGIGSIVLFLCGRVHVSKILFLTAGTGLLTGAAATIIRSLIGRTRPDAQELQGFYGIWHDSHWIIGQYQFGAFPSGHAATVIGLAAATWLLDRRFGILAALYALLVSWSRIALNCHHFSDAIAAGILGVFGAQLVLTYIAPVVMSLLQHLHNAWLARTVRGTGPPRHPVPAHIDSKVNLEPQSAANRLAGSGLGTLVSNPGQSNQSQ
jgi:membrane-associated phospholipid phosphatase